MTGKAFPISCLFCHFQEEFLLFLFLPQSDSLFEEPGHSEDELNFVASQLLDPEMSTFPTENFALLHELLLALKTKKAF